MSGSYADVPGQRFDLANDGTMLYTWKTPDYVQSNRTPEIGALAELSDASAYVGVGSIYYQTAFWAFIFPDLRSIRGLFFHMSSSSTAQFSGSVAWSPDSLDGISGTWNNVATTGIRAAWGGYAPYPLHRTAIAGVNLDGVRALRLGCYETNGSTRTGELRLAHIYGYRPAAQIDRLAFWHPTLDQELTGAYFDFGDVARGVITGGKPFRVKNLSTAKAATGVKVVAGGVQGSGLGAPGLQVSVDNTLWNIETPTFNLAPGATSDVIQARLAMTDVNLLVPQVRAGRLSTVMGAYA